MQTTELDRASLKVSQYTHFFETDNGSVLFNGYTGALAKLDPANVDPMLDLLSGRATLDSLSEEVVSQLKYGGFIVEDWLDERKVMAIKFALQNHQLSWFACTIVITEECNFSCPYCYQTNKDKRGAITESVVKSFLGYLESTIKGGADRLTISLYGGEPLLYPEKCRIICNETRKLVSSSSNTDLRLMMVTNGYLLDKNIDWMVSVGLGCLQVTVDGSEDAHNMRRPLKDELLGTYEKVVANCRLAAEAGLKIVVRVNVEKNVTGQLSDIRLQHENISIYYEPTRYDHCGDIGRYYENQDYMYKTMNGSDNQQVSAEYLSHRVGGCLATAFNSFVLMPDGTVVKCWDQVGADHQIHTNLNDPDFLVRLNHDWIDWNPYIKSSKCYNCKLLPNCGGGCAYRALNISDTCCQITEEVLQELIVKRLNENAKKCV